MPDLRRQMSSMSIVRAALAAGLAVLSLGKMLTPYTSDLSVSPTIYYGAAVLEVAAAMILYSRLSRVAEWGCVAFFAAGALLALLFDGDCG